MLSTLRSPSSARRLLVGLFACAALAISATASADPVNGSTNFDGAVRPGYQQTVEIGLRKDELTVFTVTGDGRSDIDCFLYDDSGNLISSDTDATSTCSLRSTPRWTAVFTLKVVNVGDKTSVWSGRAF